MRSTITNILFLAMFLPLHSLGQSSKASISLDRKEIKIGEQITANLVIEFPVTAKFQMILADTLASSIEIVFKGKIDTNYIGTNMSIKQLSQELILTSFDTGYHPIPPIAFYSESDSIRTEPNLIHVMDVPVEMSEQDQNEEAQIKDIKDVAQVSFSLWEWIKENWLWIVLVLVIGFGIWAYFKYFHESLMEKAPEIIPAKPIVPPHQIALEQLSALDSKKLWQNGKVKEYHIELTEIIRRYIENAMQIPALESTTDELNIALTQSGLSQQLISDLTENLQLSDLAKFAKYSPLGDENQRAFNSVKGFVISTSPKEPIDSQEEKEGHV